VPDDKRKNIKNRAEVRRERKSEITPALLKCNITNVIFTFQKGLPQPKTVTVYIITHIYPRASKKNVIYRKMQSCSARHLPEDA